MNNCTDYIHQFLYGPRTIVNAGGHATVDVCMDERLEGWIGIPYGGINMGIMMDLAMTLDAYPHRDDLIFPMSADFRFGGTSIRIGDMLHFDVAPISGGTEGNATVDHKPLPYLSSSIRYRESNGEHGKAFSAFMPEKYGPFLEELISLPSYKNCFVCGVERSHRDLICRKGFLLSHYATYKTPIWVIEHLTVKKAQGTLPRDDRFRPDPDLKKGMRAELADYATSGFDRRHMAPSADMRWDRQAMKECFYLSNMVPQVGEGMNRGIWKDLEEYVRTWAIDRGAVFIFTGPIYEGGVQKTIGKNQVAVPSHLYKIIYDPHKAEAIAFIMPNQKLDTKDVPKCIVTIRDVEKKTGLDFLSNLDRDLRDVIETQKAQGVWNK